MHSDKHILQTNVARNPAIRHFAHGNVVPRKMSTAPMTPSECLIRFSTCAPTKGYFLLILALS
jgi:hypothetical protein